MEEKRNNVRVWTLRVLLLVTSLAAFLHRPLPEGFTEGHDRLVMHVVEPVLRLSYLYPTQYLCDDAACRLWWTRGALATLSAIFGPWTMSSPVMNIETTTFDGVKVRVYTPKEKAVDDGAVFFIHGGGFVIGDIDMYEALTREIATRTKRVVVSVDYRLAPEVIFPGGLEDCERAFDHFLTVAAESYGVDPSKVVVMGDSAGGNLVAAMTQRRGRSNKTTSALGQVLVYPLLQFSDLRTPSYLRHHHENMDGFALVDPTSVAMYYMWYAGIDVLENEEWPLAAVRNEHACDEGVVDHEVLDTMTGPRELRSDCNSTRLHDEAANAIASFISNPDFAPLTQKNLTGLPQALVVTMEFDVLRDEGVVYAQRLKEAGVPTKWAHYENGFHAILNFLHFPQDVWLASRILDDILEWTDETIRNASSSR